MYILWNNIFANLSSLIFLCQQDSKTKIEVIKMEILKVQQMGQKQGAGNGILNDGSDVGKFINFTCLCG